nr:zinc finger, CCHC-type [Tanacetum cinerariifolium]
AVARLLDPKLKTFGERGIKCIFVGYVEHSKAFRFSSVPRLSLRIPNGTEEIGSSVVSEEVTKEVVTQQLEPELRKSKRNRTPKNFGLEFQLYLIEGIRDEVDLTKEFLSSRFFMKDIGETDVIMDNSSTSGWVFVLGVGAISWESKKQTCITNSTMESEFMYLEAAGKEAEWLRNLILDILLWSKPIAPISIRCDSAATLAKTYS